MPLDLTLDCHPEDKKPSFRQLLVVGNGLDLYCGLASGFSDFFEPRRKLLRCVEFKAAHWVQGWEDYLANNGLTAWDIILEVNSYNKPDPKNWNDIETTIADWITPIEHIRDEMSFVTENKHLKGICSALAGSDGLYRPSDRYSEGAIARFLIYVYGSITWNHEVLLEKLLDQLHKLEAEFSTYLRDKIDTTEGYPEKLSRVLHELVFDEISEIDKYALEHSILSFNYTIANRFLSDEGFGAIDHYVNIHGNIHNETVIGIDATGRMSDSGVAQFTKTYRVMGIGSPAVEGLVYSGRGLNSGPRTALMKFFGHSLSEADYSYFQALFDTVDLYGEETRLVFYYAPHGAADFDTACAHSKKHVMDGVIKLLMRYGETLDNVDHGKNLVHKLLLEGRLAVKLLPKSRDMWQD